MNFIVHLQKELIETGWKQAHLCTLVGARMRLKAFSFNKFFRIHVQRMLQRLRAIDTERKRLNPNKYFGSGICLAFD